MLRVETREGTVVRDFGPMCSSTLSIKVAVHLLIVTRRSLS